MKVLPDDTVVRRSDRVAGALEREGSVKGGAHHVPPRVGHK